jgi:vitamin B12 transporter
LYLKSLTTVVIGVIGIVSTIGANAQIVDSTSLVQLQEVTITNTRLQAYATGHFIQSVDTVTSRYAVASNAAELLRKFGYGHIRSYGVGGVTTPSFRGTGASHTAVLWNGINIISPLNGQSDLSLLPVTFIDDVQLQSGGSASLYGSGAIGGTIQFNNKAIFRQGFNLSLTENVGSFNTFFNGLSASWSKERWISSTKIFQTSAENNFSYISNNTATPEKLKRQHNAVEQHGVLQQNYFQINSKNLLSLRFWYQDNNYEVPNPTTVGREGTANQRDQFFRSMIGWNHDYEKGHLFVQSAHVHHLLDYRDPLINLISPSTFDSFINTFENTIEAATDLEWTSGVNYTYESSKSADLQHGGPQRNRIALYTAFKHQPGKWTNVLSARQELVNGKLTPFAPSFGSELSVHKNISLFGSVSRNYRIPTFNDLHWSDASAKGNPYLKMETSWSEEIGAKLRFSHFKGQAALYSNQVDDMIYWIQESGIWTPKNIRNAWTRGLESTGTFTQPIGKVLTEITGRYTYTLSTDESGHQLVYTPKHESGVTFRVTWNTWNLSFTNNYTGSQYTDDSNNNTASSLLKAYDIANVWVSKDFHLKKIFITTMVEMNNVFDQQTTVRRGYPLPGRNFKAGLTIRFNKPTQL